MTVEIPSSFYARFVNSSPTIPLQLPSRKNFRVKSLYWISRYISAPYGYLGIISVPVTILRSIELRKHSASRVAVERFGNLRFAFPTVAMTVALAALAFTASADASPDGNELPSPEQAGAVAETTVAPEAAEGPDATVVAPTAIPVPHEAAIAEETVVPEEYHAPDIAISSDSSVTGDQQAASTATPPPTVEAEPPPPTTSASVEEAARQAVSEVVAAADVPPPASETLPVEAAPQPQPQPDVAPVASNVRGQWYRTKNTQYQFRSEITERVAKVAASSRREAASFAAENSTEERAILSRHSGRRT
ncbi:MAG TPA: hypothetical protein VGU26_02495, partial [Gaiellaceae bacterium]|nr:hypothetical protein [Gaiellaceae bacterium]